MKPSNLIHEAYTKQDQREDIRRDVRDAVVDAMYLKKMERRKRQRSNDLPTMYERVGKKTPQQQKIRHRLKSIRDIRTSNTVTNNRGLIRDDIDVNGIYKAILHETQTFSTSLARRNPAKPLINKTQERKAVNPDPSTHLIPKESSKALEVQRGWPNIKGGR
jgi:hypothetical protein